MKDLIKEVLKNAPKKICFKKIRKFEGRIDINKISSKGFKI